MLVCEIGGIVVLVAIDAGKLAVIAWSRVAVCASVPFTLVLAGVNGKVISIVGFKTRGIPTWVRRVTNRAILWKS